ncbi:hypothetical protein QBC38DRAFT_477061 [Podospora fimiseda]|uniref:Uncharacterized protein n=1 Tax=Podospora fimiseda TaxID=252190 RepID=A0AAN7BQK9_9PEZI|nr:hypothetical protein QBC38DRAFT_477061 [Podospora fimiseda]
MDKIVTVKETDNNNTHPPSQPTTTFPPPPKQAWQHDTTETAESVWYLERTANKESNWRGTWILEAKDIEAIDWETVEMSPGLNDVYTWA